MRAQRSGGRAWLSSLWRCARLLSAIVLASTYRASGRRADSDPTPASYQCDT